ncbi:MAG TPA: dTDP-4-dehydrorhamnose 3,5-epimerase family protein [Chloroflexota bacterium]|nr:dTDP-4-dehydrorhamnose 3,5-epimerase family protein [Chloroflexota bacterium]
MAIETVGIAARGLKGPNGQALLRQTYGPTPLPEGVVLVVQRVFPDDAGGTFKEVVRLKDGVLDVPALREHGIALQPAQINVSVISPGTRRFWHVHPSQNELWTVSYGQLNAGLVDCRENSPTFELRAKVVLTPQTGIYIPAGVAHGYANESGEMAVLNYIPDKHFTAGEDTEEWRLDPTQLPFDFVLADTI